MTKWTGHDAEGKVMKFRCPFDRFLFKEEIDLMTHLIMEHAEEDSNFGFDWVHDEVRHAETILVYPEVTVDRDSRGRV